MHLVEMDRGKKATIEKNLSFVEESHRLFMIDALRFLSSGAYRYSIVYADPPFPMENKIQILHAADKGNTVKDNGLFIIHIPTEERKLWPETDCSFHLIDERKYGRSILLFYRKENNNVYD